MPYDRSAAGMEQRLQKAVKQQPTYTRLPVSLRATARIGSDAPVFRYSLPLAGKISDVVISAVGLVDNLDVRLVVTHEGGNATLTHEQEIKAGANRAKNLPILPRDELSLYLLGPGSIEDLTLSFVYNYENV